jgi:hypothetical protein
MKHLVAALVLLGGCTANPARPTPPPRPETPPSTPGPMPPPADMTPPPAPPPAKGKVTLTVANPDGTPRSVQVITHGIDGVPTASLNAVGRAEVDVVAGGAVTAIDQTSPYMVTWLEVQPGDQLRDAQQPPPGPGTATGTTTPHAADITNVPASVRFLRAKVAVHDGATLYADAELAAMPSAGHAAGTLALSDGPATAKADRTLILYENNTTPESPSSWLFDSAAVPAPTTFDAARALPFIDHVKASVDRERRISVNWQRTGAIDVKVAKVLVVWHDGSALDSFWDVRFPYRTDGVTLPRLPPDVTLARLPAPTATLMLFAEVGLMDFADAASADAFRRDPRIWGIGPVGATRDLVQLGAAGVTRLVFDTPF